MTTSAGDPPVSPSVGGATSDIACVGGGVGDATGPFSAGNKADTPTVMTVGNAKKNNTLKLPPPADKTKYTNNEVIDLVITHNDKRGVVQAIDTSQYRPKKSALYQMLKQKTPFDKETLIHLLREHYVGTREWSERISKITSYTGQSEQEIRRIIGVSIDYDSDEEDEEVIAICSNQSSTTTSSTSLKLSTPSTISTSSSSVTSSMPSIASTSPASSTSGSPNCTPPQIRSPSPSDGAKKRKSPDITSDDDDNATDLPSFSTNGILSNSDIQRPTPNRSEAYDLNRAAQTFHAAIEKDGVTPEILAHFNAISEAINNASNSKPTNTAATTTANNNNTTQRTNPKSKRSKKSDRHERLTTALPAILPRFRGDTTQWKDSNKTVVKSTTCADAQDMRTFLAAITGCDSTRAANAIIHLLNRSDNAQIKAEVVKAYAPNDGKVEVYELILGGIRDGIAHHTNKKGGTRTIAAETFVKNIVAACMWRIVNTGASTASTAISEIIGTTWHQIRIGRTTVEQLIADDAQIKALLRERRKDYIREKLEPFLYRWLLDDNVTRLDTKQNKINVIDPRTGVESEVHRRIWRIINKEHQWYSFLNSKAYEDFCDSNVGATVGYDVFRDVLSKFSKIVCNPLPESCVDEKTTGLEHCMSAVLSLITQPDVKAVLEDAVVYSHGLTYDEFAEVLKKAGSYQFVDAMCCDKEEQPELQICQDVPCPKTIPLKCTHGVDGKRKKQCPCCGFKNRLGTLCDAVRNNEEIANKVVEVKVWEEAPRQGVNSKGKQNSQKELTTKHMTAKELMDNFEAQTNTAIPHVAEIYWINHLQGIDFARLPKDCILIFTDFAASMCLRAFQAKNSSVDGHAVCANFVVIWNRRIAKVKEKDKDENGDVTEEVKDIQIWTVDVHHFFAETLSKGKKSDHAMHNCCLRAIIAYYQSLLQSRGITLKHVIIWTDNAPHQYRCRQTFIQVASVEARFPGIKVTHRLAVVDNFKGNHDAVGKDPLRKVKELELQGIRSPNAWKVFLNCDKHLASTDTHWGQYESDGDARLQHKGKYGMDSRTVWYVVENEEDRVRRAAEQPDLADRILVCDRTYIQDTVGKKCITDTSKLHEVRSVATSVPPAHEGIIQTFLPVARNRKNERPEIRGLIREWDVAVCDLPCSCKQCIKDPDTPLCPFLPWRNRRTVNMREVVQDQQQPQLAEEDEEEDETCNT